MRFWSHFAFKMGAWAGVFHAKNWWKWWYNLGVDFELILGRFFNDFGMIFWMISEGVFCKWLKGTNPRKYWPCQWKQGFWHVANHETNIKQMMKFRWFFGSVFWLIFGWFLDVIWPDFGRILASKTHPKFNKKRDGHFHGFWMDFGCKMASKIR